MQRTSLHACSETKQPLTTQAREAAALAVSKTWLSTSLSMLLDVLQLLVVYDLKCWP